MIKTKKTIIAVAIGLFLIVSLPFNAHASSISRDGVVGLVNQARAERGLNTLTVNSRLQAAAQAKADDMIAKDYWEHFHKGKTPWDWMNETGYEYFDAGENLAIDFSDLETMHQAWMNSPTHKANIVNSKYKEIGIGISSGDFEGHQTIIVVQMFGNPKVVQSTASQIVNQIPLPAAQADSLEPAKVNLFNNFLNFVLDNYRSNFRRGFAQIHSIFLQNFSAAAEN